MKSCVKEQHAENGKNYERQNQCWTKIKYLDILPSLKKQWKMTVEDSKETPKNSVSSTE
jgi:hypothetical protein